MQVMSFKLLADNLDKYLDSGVAFTVEFRCCVNAIVRYDCVFASFAYILLNKTVINSIEISKSKFV